MGAVQFSDKKQQNIMRNKKTVRRNMSQNFRYKRHQFVTPEYLFQQPAILIKFFTIIKKESPPLGNVIFLKLNISNSRISDKITQVARDPGTQSLNKPINFQLPQIPLLAQTYQSTAEMNAGDRDRHAKPENFSSSSSKGYIKRSIIEERESESANLLNKIQKRISDQIKAHHSINKNEKHSNQQYLEQLNYSAPSTNTNLTHDKHLRKKGNLEPLYVGMSDPMVEQLSIDSGNKELSDSKANSKLLSREIDIKMVNQDSQKKHNFVKNKDSDLERADLKYQKEMNEVIQIAKQNASRPLIAKPFQLPQNMKCEINDFLVQNQQHKAFSFASQFQAPTTRFYKVRVILPPIQQSDLSQLSVENLYDSFQLSSIEDKSSRNLKLSIILQTFDKVQIARRAILEHELQLQDKEELRRRKVALHVRFFQLIEELDEQDYRYAIFSLGNTIQLMIRN